MNYFISSKNYRPKKLLDICGLSLYDQDQSLYTTEIVWYTVRSNSQTETIYESTIGRIPVSHTEILTIICVQRQSWGEPTTISRSKLIRQPSALRALCAPKVSPHSISRAKYLKGSEGVRNIDCLVTLKADSLAKSNRQLSQHKNVLKSLKHLPIIQMFLKHPNGHFYRKHN